MKKHYLISLIIAALAAGGAFWGGMAFGKTAQASRPNAAGVRAFANQGANANFRANVGGNFAARGAMGEILSIDGETMSVSVQGGGSKLVLLSDSTKVTKTADGSLSDLKVGDSVVATGTTNADGSVSASDIQIRPDLPQMNRAGEKTNPPVAQ